MILFHLLGVFIFISNIQSSQILTLRGVATSKISLYSLSVDFTCFDGSSTVPPTYVNDNFCDCLDGSDEPGTSACPNGEFHCTNVGHQPVNIPSSRVNDGICDCCDGSDEYVIGNCTDNCSTLGEEARIAAQNRAQVVKLGMEMRVQLSQKGKRLKQEKQERLESLQKDRMEAEAVKAEKEALKTEAETAENAALETYRAIEEAEKNQRDEEEKKAEAREAFEIFHQLDSDHNEILTVAELQTRNTFDQNKDGEVSEEEIKFLLGDLTELSWDNYFSVAWLRMKPLFMKEKGLFLPPEKEPDEDADKPGETEDQAEESPDILNNEKEWNAEAEGNEEQEEDEQFRREEDDEEDEEDGEQETKGDQAEEGGAPEEPTETESKYDEETQQLIDRATQARNDYEAAERSVRDVEREMRQLEESLGKDYGPDEEFAPLDGECFEYSDREYTYKLCPFDQVSQRPVSGGAETRLGAWQGWQGGQYSTMIYDKGQSCWNGPQRSAQVVLDCGTENKIRSVSEPNKCEYLVHFTAPSACRPPAAVSDQTYVHDEL